MGKHGPKPPSPERVARILVDAEELGDFRAGQKHHVAERTVQHYRTTYGSDLNVVELCEQYKKALQADWFRRAKEVRRKALRNLEVEMPTASARDLAGIFKIVHEGILAQEVIEQGSNDHDGQDPEPGFEPPVGGAPESDKDAKVYH